MNNLDFYKLKYLKYKNKYISLKNKNELELKGGLTSESGIFLFYIPETVLTANNIGFPLEEKGKFVSRLISKDGIISTLSFQNLYDMSILVIPPAPDKVNISSTNEWYIPQKSTGFLKKNEPIKWGENKTINYDIGTKKIKYDPTSQKRWLYYIAKEFLNKHSKLANLANLDKQRMICLEYDVSNVVANKFISKTYIDSIEFFQHYLKKYYEDYKSINSLVDAKIKLDTDLPTVSKKYYDARTKTVATYKIVFDTQTKLNESKEKLIQAQEKLKTSEEKLTQVQIETLKKNIEEANTQIEQFTKIKEKADEQYTADTKNEAKETLNKNCIDEKLKDIMKLGEFVATNIVEFETANKDLFKTFLTPTEKENETKKGCIYITG